MNSLNWGLVYMNTTKEVSGTVSGDINSDGLVDMNDLVLILRILSGGDVSGIELNGDVNEDGILGPAEVFYILRELAGLNG